MRETRIRFGPFEADLASRELFREGLRVTLQEQPFLFLSTLLERPRELVTRDELRQRLWPDGTNVEHDIGLNKAAAKLREALGDDAASPLYVETLPKRGYRFIGSIVRNGDGTGVSTGPGGPPTVALENGRRTPFMARIAIGAVIGILLLAVSFVVVRRQIASRQRRVVIVVLPLKNLDPDRGAAYLGDGITVDLINLLGRIHPEAIGVIAPTSAMAYRNTAKPIREIAAELGADYVAEGSIRHAGSQLHVTAQLTRASDQTQLWADSFDAPAQAIQRVVVQAIAIAVRVEVLPQHLLAVKKAPTASPEAYDEYLKGIYLQRTDGIAMRILPHLERAVTLDPNFAAAFATLANTYSHLGPRNAYMARAAGAAERAVQLDPGLGAAHAELANIRMTWQWDWKGAEHEFRRALALAPDDPDVLLLYAQYLSTCRRVPEAIRVLQHAEQLDPRSPLIVQNLGRTRYFGRTYDQAMFEYERALRLDPDFFWAHVFLKFACEDRHDYANWLAHLEREVTINGHAENIPKIEMRVQKIGLPAFHETLLLNLAAHVDYGTAETFTPAIGLLKIKCYDDALRMMERLMANHPRDAIFLKVDPVYDPVRNDPRFVAMVRRVGIP